MRIFYLDDEELLCSMFEMYFEDSPHELETFTDPEQFIEQSNKQSPDLLFIDYRLPGQTGDEVAMAIDDSIPKILITGDLTVQTQYKFKEIVGKPFDFENIMQIIDQFSK